MSDRAAPRACLLLAALLAAVCGACGSSERIGRETLFPYMEAVHDEAWDDLYCLSTGAAGGGRTAFADWARAWLERYEEGRDEGFVDVESNPIALVKLFALGRGAWYSIDAAERVDERTLRLATTVRFGYEQANLSRLSPGTTFYLAAKPPGAVRAVRVPSGPREIDAEVLDTVLVEWTLVRVDAEDGCAERWTVADAVPRAETATTTSVTWIF